MEGIPVVIRPWYLPLGNGLRCAEVAKAWHQVARCPEALPGPLQLNARCKCRGEARQLPTPTPCESCSAGVVAADALPDANGSLLNLSFQSKLLLQVEYLENAVACLFVLTLSRVCFFVICIFEFGRHVVSKYRGKS